MGCVVNGPGEAKEADVGIAGGKGMGLLFRKGRVVKKVREKDFASVLLKEVEEMSKEPI
jgi:(E)-4-hydroxy-3-methylbut-2-enyl-diphosphate synthase